MKSIRSQGPDFYYTHIGINAQNLNKLYHSKKLDRLVFHPAFFFNLSFSSLQYLISYQFLLFKTCWRLKPFDERRLAHSFASNEQNPGHGSPKNNVNSPVGEDEILLRRFFVCALPSQLAACASFRFVMRIQFASYVRLIFNSPQLSLLLKA